MNPCNRNLLIYNISNQLDKQHKLELLINRSDSANNLNNGKETSKSIISKRESRSKDLMTQLV